MRRDIRISTENEKFKYRVSGLLIKNNKLLVVKIDNNSFYCLPGGHVELLEDTREAIIREFKEETNIDVNIKSLLYIIENFFKSGKYNCHEVGIYYLLDTEQLINFDDYVVDEQDKDKITKLSFKWFDIDNLKNVKPEFLKDRIRNNKNNIQHLIIKNDKIIIEE